MSKKYEWKSSDNLFVPTHNRFSELMASRQQYADFLDALWYTAYPTFYGKGTVEMIAALQNSLGIKKSLLGKPKKKKFKAKTVEI